MNHSILTTATPSLDQRKAVYGSITNSDSQTNNPPHLIKRILNHPYQKHLLNLQPLPNLNWNLNRKMLHNKMLPLLLNTPLPELHRCQSQETLLQDIQLVTTRQESTLSSMMTLTTQNKTLLRFNPHHQMS